MRRPIQDVLEELTERVLVLPGVTGTAQGLRDGQPCLKVFLVRRTSDLVRQIPAALDGYPVLLEETGPLRAL